MPVVLAVTPMVKMSLVVEQHTEIERDLAMEWKPEMLAASMPI